MPFLVHNITVAYVAVIFIRRIVMKRFVALICAVVLAGLILCSCMNNNMTNDAWQNATETVYGIREDTTEYSNDNNGLLDDNREDITPTNPTVDNTDGIYTENGNIVDEMIEDGEVNDGDGYVGDAENYDNDRYIDDNAAVDNQDNNINDNDSVR